VGAELGHADRRTERQTDKQPDNISVEESAIMAN